MNYSITGVALAVALALGGCSNPPAVAQTDSGQVASAKPASATPFIGGKPLWSSTKTYTAQQNAQRVFASNGAQFGAADVDAYVKAAHAFIDSPPSGSQTLTRSNGDTLIYDPKGNVFAVVTKDGAPRTMFKPSTGAAYWQQQVASGGEFTAKSTASNSTSATAG